MTDIAPWLSIADTATGIRFYQAAFGAVVLERQDDESGAALVAQLSIDGADFWVNADPESTPEALGGRSVRMILTVDDPDTVFASSVAAGATVVAEMYEDFGWRIGRIADPCGHHWEIGRRLPSRVGTLAT